VLLALTDAFVVMQALFTAVTLMSLPDTLMPVVVIEAELPFKRTVSAVGVALFTLVKVTLLRATLTLLALPSTTMLLVVQLFN